MNIFIIGGTKLMGPHLVGELESAGHETACFNRRGIHPKNGRSFKGDRDDHGTLRSAVLDSKPDLVIDMIPFTEEQAISLGKILRETGSPLVAGSSIDVYRAYNILKGLEEPPFQTCPIKESDDLRSILSPEGKRYDKLNVEKQFLSLVVDVTILRLPGIYGWPDRIRIQEYVDQIVDTGKVAMHPLAAKWHFSRALNENCAFAISLAVGRSGKSIYNVAEQECFTDEQWCRKIGRHLDWDGEIVLDESVELDADLRQDWIVDTSLIREEPGFYEKYDGDEGLRRCIVKYLESEKMASEEGGQCPVRQVRCKNARAIFIQIQGARRALSGLSNRRATRIRRKYLCFRECERIDQLEKRAA